MSQTISIKTKFGWISVFENKGKIFRIKFGRGKRQQKTKNLENFKKNLLEFFNKKRLNIKASYKIDGSLTQKKIWNELKKIRPGHTKSYGQIAKKFKLSPRYIGKICGQNKLMLVIPCHRVIRSDGTLGGFSSVGGLKLKKELLKFEKNWN